MAEGVNFVARREDDEEDLGATEGADLVAFVEKTGSTLGEGDLKVVLVFHLHHLDLLSSLTFRHGIFLKREMVMEEGSKANSRERLT